MGLMRTGLPSIDRRRSIRAGAATVALGTVQVASSAADPAPVTGRSRAPAPSKASSYLTVSPRCRCWPSSLRGRP